MRKSRFSEGQMIGVLRGQESGATTAEVCRRHGISADLLSVEGEVWRAGPVGRTALGLEDENQRLKKLLAELMLEVAALKDLLAKNRARLRRGVGRRYV